MTTNQMRKGQTYTLPVDITGVEVGTYTGSVRLNGRYWLFSTEAGQVIVPAGDPGVAVAL
jgi:hypothetical protein